MASSSLRNVPSISVVMPVRNGERHVVAAVQSILTQTYDDLELIAVDDGSSDATGDLLATLARQDHRLRVLTATGRGFVAAVRSGIAASTARWIARMDADDISEPGRLGAQWSYLEQHPEVALVGTATEVINDDGSHHSAIRFPLDDVLIRLCLRSSTTFAHGSVMVRRDALDAVGGYRQDHYPAEDYDLWCRLVASGVQSANLDAPLYRYRLSPEGVSRTTTEAQAAAAQQVGRSYGASGIELPSLVDTLRAIGRIDTAVRTAEADPRALRRAAQSLLECASGWTRDRRPAAVSAVAGAVRAELCYRRRRGRS